MKKKMLENILHVLHIIDESLKNIGIALAKSLGLTGKSQLLLARKIVLISLVVTSASAVSFSEMDLTTVQDGPYIHPQTSLVDNSTHVVNETQIKNTTVKAKKTICEVCNGKGNFICTTCNGKGTVICENCSGYGCTACGGDGKVTCPGCQFKCINGICECPCCNGDGYYEPEKGDRYIID